MPRDLAPLPDPGDERACREWVEQAFERLMSDEGFKAAMLRLVESYVRQHEEALGDEEAAP